MDGCSECSEPITISANFLGVTEPSNCSDISWTAYDYTSLWWEYRALLFKHHPPEHVSAVIAALVLLALALGGAGFVSRKVGQTLDCRRSRLSVLDSLRFAATLQVCLYTIISTSKGGGILPDPLQRIGGWGIASFPLFFVHSGFTTALRRAETAADAQVWPLMRDAISSYYPIFLASSLAGLLLAAIGQGVQLTGEYILMMPLCVGAWDRTLRTSNQANAPSWIVGALLFNLAFALPACVRLQTLMPKGMSRVLVLMFAFTLWQACNETSITVLVLDNVFTFFALAPSVPAYLFGLVLGNLHLLHHPTLRHAELDAPNDLTAAQSPVRFGKLYNLAEHYGLTASSIAYVLIVAFVDAKEFSPFMTAWARAGMLLPLFGLAVIGAAGGADAFAIAISAPISIIPVRPFDGRTLLPFPVCLPVLICRRVTARC